MKSQKEWHLCLSCCVERLGGWVVCGERPTGGTFRSQRVVASICFGFAQLFVVSPMCNSRRSYPSCAIM